jgi:predicted ArsR family transcriptional regulator
MSFTRPADVAALNGLSHLDDSLRRQLYEFVVDSDGPVSREQAAAAASIGRTLAAYHLDKLADAGLLCVSYQRPAGGCRR